MTDALARAVAFKRFRAADVRPILTAGTSASLPVPAGGALVVDLLVAPTRSLAAYGITAVSSLGMSCCTLTFILTLAATPDAGRCRSRHEVAHNFRGAGSLVSGTHPRPPRTRLPRFVPLSLAESAVVVVRVGVVVGGQVMTPARIAMAIMAARSPVPSFRPMRAR